MTKAISTTENFIHPWLNRLGIGISSQLNLCKIEKTVGSLSDSHWNFLAANTIKISQ